MGIRTFVGSPPTEASFRLLTRAPLKKKSCRITFVTIASAPSSDCCVCMPFVEFKVSRIAVVLVYFCLREKHAHSLFSRRPSSLLFQYRFCPRRSLVPLLHSPAALKARGWRAYLNILSFIEIIPIGARKCNVPSPVVDYLDCGCV